MGQVFLVEDPEGKRVALKTLTHPKNKLHVARFRREIEHHQRLKIKGILQVFDTGETDDRPWFSMEYISGPNLQTVLKQRGRLDWQEARRIVLAISIALQKVHELGFVHRDIKPSNILLRQDGSPVLVDFGLIRKVEPDAHTHLTHRPIGTPAYMAPEILKSDATDWVRADIYALGAVLAHCVLGRNPSVEWDLEDAPPSLHPVLKRALASRPDERYPNVEAFIADLRKERWSLPTLSYYAGGGSLFIIAIALGLLLWRLLAPPPAAQPRHFWGAHPSGQKRRCKRALFGLGCPPLSQ